LEIMDRIIRYYIILLFVFVSCSDRTDRETLMIISDIQNKYLPDARTGIFTVSAEGNNPVIITGETNLPEAKSALSEMLEAAGIQFKNEISLLPAAELGEQKFGLINLSVANLRSQPKHSAELVTQALLGTPVSILKEDDGWFLIQTPDKYIAWVTGGSLVTKSDRELQAWKNEKKIVYLNTSGFSVNTLGLGRVSDLVAGDILVLESEEEKYWKVIYPDSRHALVPKSEAFELVNWQESIELSDSSLMQKALSLIGTPYLWGGTSTKGLDCSGFTKTVYLLHGLVLPRDASQQVFAGTLVDSIGDFSQLKIGDLLFFGRKNEDGSEKVIHVGMWIGDDNFIHSSGDVHISSLDSLDEKFDRYNFNRYLRSKRVIGNDSPLVLDLSTYFQSDK
jgi:gamma-D-glutamyl-L-lysine dipeptidyl-peptidase